VRYIHVAIALIFPVTYNTVIATGFPVTMRYSDLAIASCFTVT